MIRNNIGFYPLFKKNSLLVGSILLINIAMSHKCYVCGPNNGDANATDIPSCKLFDPNSTKFIRICPTTSMGCSLQINGTVYTRSCEKIAFDTCQTANKVDYCYCMGELCNRYSTQLSDDEDTSFEGSGQSNSNSNTDDGLLTDVTRNIMHDVTTTTTETIPTATGREVYSSSAAPYKNDSPDAEVQFRNIVAVYDVLKDPSKHMYGKWNFIVLTIGQYFVSWAAHIEKKYTAEQVYGTKMKKQQKKNEQVSAVIIEKFVVPKPSSMNTLPIQIPSV
ncbi:uncharacterized protein CBL_14307 [Carabus blaptoides fortunei]